MVPSKAALVRVIILVILFPRGYLVSAYLTERVHSGALLQDLDDIPTFHPIKVVPKSASDAARPVHPVK